MHQFIKFYFYILPVQLVFTLFFLGFHPIIVAATHLEYLPPEVQKLIIERKIPQDSVGFSIVSLNPSDHPQVGDSIGWNADKAFNPASTIKLLTTLSALDQLGSDYRFKTALYLKGKVERGNLEGRLFIKGFGDPKLVPENLIRLLEELKGTGVNTINADITLDISAYDPSVKDSAPYDGEETKAYNVVPNPLLYAFQTISFNLSTHNNTVEITYTPLLADFKVINQLQTYAGNCTNWKKDVRLTVTTQEDGKWVAIFRGKFPSKCSNALWNSASIPNEQFLKMGLVAAWESIGGKWLKTPSVQLAKLPNDASLLLQFSGTSLTEAVLDTNKFSNNVMARQLFLTPAVENSKGSVSTQDGISMMRKWLQQHQLSMPELVLENGSGLSDIERISPKHMTDVLNYAAYSKNKEVFISSLPIAGIDGTMRHRLIHHFRNMIAHILHENAPQKILDLPERLHESGAYIKTGTLHHVRSIAGYVVSKTGKVYAVSSMINHEPADGLSTINDALIMWLADDGPTKIPTKPKIAPNR